jgi:hypothetical protein
MGPEARAVPYLRLREPPSAARARASERLRPLLADRVEVYCYLKHRTTRAGACAERLMALAVGPRADSYAGFA